MNRYVLLLRGVNVGGRMVSMATLKALLASAGYSDVTTYINSGNAVFSSDITPDAATLGNQIKQAFGFDIPLLILPAEQVQAIAAAIPTEWVNDSSQKTDVTYLFPDIDTANVITQIGYRPEFENVLYVPGALIHNVTRQNQSRSSLMKVVSTPLYGQMTVRNVNTARKLAALCET